MLLSPIVAARTAMGSVGSQVHWLWAESASEVSDGGQCRCRCKRRCQHRCQPSGVRVGSAAVQQPAQTPRHGLHAHDLALEAAGIVLRLAVRVPAHTG